MKVRKSFMTKSEESPTIIMAQRRTATASKEELNIIIIKISSGSICSKMGEEKVCREVTTSLGDGCDGN